MFQFENSTDKINWTVEYPRKLYEAGDYTATVELMRSYYGFWIRENVASTTFKLTGLQFDLIYMLVECGINLN